MKKAVIYYFSGTGNTEAVSKLYKEEFEKSNIETVTYKITKDWNNCPNPNDFDYIGLGYPIHGFNSPMLFIKFIKALPKVDNKKTFILKTSGEPLAINDASSQKIIKILVNKNYSVDLERHIVMPYNMIFRHCDEIAKQMWIYAKALSKVYVQEIINDKKEKVKMSMIKKIHTYPFRIEWPFYKINGKFYKVDSDKCINCLKCVKICPTHNIKYVDGKFKFGANCLLCTACSFGCPVNAISIGMMNGWKVNGDYNLKKLEQDKNIVFPFVTDKTKGAYRLYLSYFKKADKILADNGVKLLNV